MKWPTRVAAAMTAALVLATVAVSVAPAARSTPLPNPLDAEDNCYSLTPAAVHVAGIDNDAPISVDLFLVLDRGITEKRARQVVDNAKESYAPLGIRLRVAGVRSAVLKGTDAVALIAQTAQLFPAAERPKATDVVATLTSADIRAAGDSGVAGMASCSGGVRYPGKSFLVAEVPRPDTGYDFAGAHFVRITAEKVFAHELGHLFGASHEQGNCVEGVPSGATEREVSPCTLMSGIGGFDSMNFGTIERTVVRGYADEFARP